MREALGERGSEFSLRDPQRGRRRGGCGAGSVCDVSREAGWWAAGSGRGGCDVSREAAGGPWTVADGPGAGALGGDVG